MVLGFEQVIEPLLSLVPNVEYKNRLADTTTCFGDDYWTTVPVTFIGGGGAVALDPP